MSVLHSPSTSNGIFLTCVPCVSSADECDYVINKATPRLARSGVVDEGGEGKDAISDVRTSNGMFFERGEDPIIQRIEERLSKYSLIPVGNGEGMQVLRYEHGQEYKPHFDYFFHPEGESNGGNRLATVLMYLQGAEEGGETVFPNVPKPATQTKENGFSECSMQGLAVKAKRGDAVLFFSLKTDGVLDRGSLHGSCPTSKGTKWAATKWFHVAHYAMGNEIPKTVHHVTFKELRPPAPPGCKDEHTSCEGWAEAGECDSNPGFMVGIKGDPGKCLLSCGRCDLLLEVKAPNERTPDEV